MDREMEWNAEVTKIHHTNYVRNSRAITFAWFVFSACYTILNVIAFIQPFWFGDTNESPGVGYFGLYKRCERTQGSDYTCEGTFLDFNSIPNSWFQAASFLVGGAALLFIISIICMILFMFLKARIVLRVCGWLQLIAAVFMIVACVIFPAGFDDENVQRVCGNEAKAYMMDKCQIRWAYILSIVLIFDALILAILAFVLAARQAKMVPEFKRMKEEHVRYIHEWQDKSHINNGFSSTEGRTRQSHRYNTLEPQPVRKRHQYTNIQPQPAPQPAFTIADPTTEAAHDAPLHIPVSDLDPEDSPPSSTRMGAGEGQSSVRSRSSRSSGSQKSPRSDDSISGEVIQGFDRIADIRSQSESSASSGYGAADADVQPDDDIHL